MSPKISVVIHTLNAGETLEQLLHSVRWADELIVADMQSDDETRAIAKRFNATIYSVEPHPRVDAVRNAYLEKAEGPWILVMDADEYLAEDGEKQIHSLVKTKGDRYDAFAIPRFNRIGSHVMRGSGWYPDPQIRLFRKGCVQWKDATHRPPKVITGFSRLLTLTPPCLHIHHSNYRSVSEFIERQMRYALNDTYSDDRTAFHFSNYVAAAHREYIRRYDPEHDGDLSRALATVMAWDRIMRGLIHWERLDYPDRLNEPFSFPMTPEQLPMEYRCELEELRRRVQQQQHELDTLNRSRTVRFNRWFSATVLEPLRRRFMVR